MTDDLLICPTCGWLYLSMSEEGRVLVCRRPSCRCRPLRQATAEERAALPIGATVGEPKQDILLKDSRRFYALETGGWCEVYDNYIDNGNNGNQKSLILDDVTAEAVEAMTEGFLKTVTPAREVEVAVVVDLGKFLTAVSGGRIPTVPRDDPFLVGLIRNRGAKMGMAVVTIPASWEAGDSDLHEAGWYIDRRGEVEEVCKRASRITAEGTVYHPKPKEVLFRSGID